MFNKVILATYDYWACEMRLVQIEMYYKYKYTRDFEDLIQKNAKIFYIDYTWKDNILDTMD